MYKINSTRKALFGGGSYAHLKINQFRVTAIMENPPSIYEWLSTHHRHASFVLVLFYCFLYAPYDPCALGARPLQLVSFSLVHISVVYLSWCFLLISTKQQERRAERRKRFLCLRTPSFLVLGLTNTLPLLEQKYGCLKYAKDSF